MDLKKKVVIQIPVEEIWNDFETISEERLNFLDEKEIKALLKQSKVQFIIANTGFPLNWIPVDNCFDFFKTELKNKIADKEANYLDSFSSGYFFYASKWKSNNVVPVVLLEMYH